MADPIKALETQLANIEKRTGKTLAELKALLASSGLVKHGELRDHLKSTLGMGHGDANTVVHFHLQDQVKAAGAGPAEDADPLDAIYTGPKADLRPIHDAVMAKIAKLGPFEEAPKKAYVSLRRKKQFAMVGPATKTQVEVGLNAKGLVGGDRLVELPPGGMCNYKVRIGSVAEVDSELIAWIKSAYDSAG